jgi:hypothetical protein
MKALKMGRHRVIVEDIRGLGKTRLRDILGSELKAISKKLGMVRTNNAGEDVETYIIPELQGHASEKIKESLKRSTLTGIWLIDSTVKGEFDEVAGAKIARREIKFDVSDQSAIKRLTEWGKREKYDKMRLVWNDPEGAGRPERASVDITQKDVADTFFIRQRKVKLSKPLPEAVQTLCEEMIHKMQKVT